MLKVIKFSKDGCRPCVILKNVLSEIIFENYESELVQINISEQPEYIEKYGLTSVPVLVFIKDGKEIDRINGLTDVDTIVDKLRSLY